MTQPANSMPSFAQLFRGVRLAFDEYVLQWDKYPTNTTAVYARLTSTTPADFLLVAAVAIGLTLGRAAAASRIYKPLSLWLRLRPVDHAKFAESMWKVFVYTSLWSYSIYVILLSGRYNFFYQPCSMVDLNLNEIFNVPVPFDIYVMYMCQIGFYLHGLYATLRMDVWRKDSAMMVFHHFLTIFLLYFSYTMRYHNIGALVLLLHDVSDVILEFTKLNVYLKSRGGPWAVMYDALAAFGFAVFSFSWALCRLYWFPFKVIHTANWCVYQYHRGRYPHMFLVLNFMLMTLQLLHIYWFFFILHFLYKVASGQTSTVEDLREYDLDDEPQQKAPLEAAEPTANGHLPVPSSEEQTVRRRQS